MEWTLQILNELERITVLSRYAIGGAMFATFLWRTDPDVRPGHHRLIAGNAGRPAELASGRAVAARGGVKR